MRRALTLDAYKEMVGQTIGQSEWFLIDQSRINAFADITEDHQFIHVDPVAAAATPFEGTVAHGFLVLSMLAAMALSATPTIVGATMSVNYGMKNLRFIKAVRAGKHIRGRFDLLDIKERAPGQWQTTFAVVIEIEDEDKPSIIAEWLFLHFLDAV